MSSEFRIDGSKTMSNGYRPTTALRQQEMFSVNGMTLRLQQLWRSIYEDEEDEWRDVEIIPWLKDVTVQPKREPK